MIEIPFVFKATVRTGSGGRDEKRYRDSIEFPLRSIPIDQTKVVLRHRGLLTHGYVQGEKPMLDIVLHDGNIYEPVLTSSWRDGTHVLEKIVRGKFHADPKHEDELIKSHILGQIRLEHGCLQQEEVKETRYPRPERVVESNRERVTATMQALADDFVLIDDVLHRRVPEPVLLASHRGVTLARSINALEFNERYHAYRLDEFSEAKAFADVLAQEDKRSGDPVNAEFELLDGSWLQHQVDEEMILGAVTKFRDAVALYVPILPIPAMVAFCHLRDAIRPRRYDPEFVMDYQAVLDRTEELMEVVEGLGHRLPVAVTRAVIERARGSAAAMEEDLSNFAI